MTTWHSFVEFDGAPQAAALGPTLAERGKAPAPAAFRTNGRPTYAPNLPGTYSSLPRPFLQTLLWQFYKTVPIIGRALTVLAGLTGCPEIKSEDPETEADLQQWARMVGYGKIGQGLAAWIPDHLRQAALYGYGIGEMQATPLRDDIERLWSYRSPRFTIEAKGDGSLQIIQPDGLDGARTVLNENTVLHTVHQPEGCDPYGQSLFFACSSFAQLLLDVFHAHGATWRRSGIPTYHLNWQPYEGPAGASFQDTDGSVGAGIVSQMQGAWNKAIKSQVVNGVAEDFFSSGKVTITSVGADMQPMEIEVSVRAILEELVMVTGIPPILLGLQWSTTERMGSVQADLLTSHIDTYRRMIGGTLEKVIRTRQLLKGNDAPWELHWCDLSLQDMVETAKAAQMDAAAALSRQKFWVENWRLGFVDQQGAAKEITGEDSIVKEMEEPPGAPAGNEPAGNGGNANPGGAEMQVLTVADVRNALVRT